MEIKPTLKLTPKATYKMNKKQNETFDIEKYIATLNFSLSEYLASLILQEGATKWYYFLTESV